MSTDLEQLCSVCQQNTAVGVAAVPGVPISCAYCRDCLNANAHPLHVLIANTALCGGYGQTADWWQQMVDDTLAHLNRTRLWFDAEVDQNMAEIAEHERALGEQNEIVRLDFEEE